MKLVSRLFFIMVLLDILPTNNIAAQLGVNAAKVAAHGIIAIAGGSRQEKQEKIIEQSITQEKIGGLKVTVLRVKETDIKSKAKVHIITLQNRLNHYDSLYKNNQPIDIPKNDSDLIAIMDKDEDWPTQYYAGEIKAYKRYAFQQKQKASAAPADSLHAIPANPVNADTTKTKL